MDEKALKKRILDLEEVPTDDVLNLAFIYGQQYPDRIDQNLYAAVWAERVGKGQS